MLEHSGWTSWQALNSMHDMRCLLCKDLVCVPKPTIALGNWERLEAKEMVHERGSKCFICFSCFEKDFMKYEILEDLCTKAEAYYCFCCVKSINWTEHHYTIEITEPLMMKFGFHEECYESSAPDELCYRE